MKARIKELFESYDRPYPLTHSDVADLLQDITIPFANVGTALTELVEEGYLYKDNCRCYFRVMGDDWRQENRKSPAACGTCGGWSNFGGMSHHYDGPNGCNCNK